MFFTDDRLNFFKPLTSKYREQIVQCLCLLYQRQYSSSADYGQSLNREQLIGIFEEALARTDSKLLDEFGEDNDLRFKNSREQASWILKQLIDSGWLEKHIDTATFQSTFPFTRLGRIFSQSLIESDNTHIRTRHRNTRNTLNALEAFTNRGEVYDLFDAFEYSERIISDFTDIISELEDRKRQLVKEVKSEQLVQQATNQFFDYMEKRFQPDIQVRLSADSVEKHKEKISKVIKKIRQKDKDFKHNAELDIRRIEPDLCSKDQSYLFYILEIIEQRMRNASEIMLPALRKALHSFTKRADIIIRQLSYLNMEQDNKLLEVCRELADLPENEYQQRLNNAADEMQIMKVQLIDPQHIKLNDKQLKRVVDTSVTSVKRLDMNARRELMIQQLLDQAFASNDSHIKEYVVNSLRDGRKISTRELQIDDAKQLLAVAHIIEVGAINDTSSDFKFKVKPTGRRVNDTEYYKEFDEFIIELIPNQDEKIIQS
jgi:hypothetical protein